MDLSSKLEHAMIKRQAITNSSESQLSTVQGQLERVTFYNEETDFTIARLKVSGYRDLITLVGTMMAPTPGQVMRAVGARNSVWVLARFPCSLRLDRLKTGFMHTVQVETSSVLYGLR